MSQPRSPHPSSSNFIRILEIIKIKESALLHLCHHNFVQSFITSIFYGYINDLVPHFLTLKIRSSLIDFMYLGRHIHVGTGKGKHTSISGLCKAVNNVNIMPICVLNIELT